VNLSSVWWKKDGKSRILLLLLALTFVHGLLYAAVIPPWQSPDEPYHLLSGLLPRLARDPTPESTLDRIKDEMLSSLVEFHFWDTIVHVPAVREREEIDRNLPAGFAFVPETKPRSYVHYLLFAGLWPVFHQEVVLQLYWARLLSVLTNLAIVAIAYATAHLLFGDDPFGVVLLPLSIVLLPQHTFILSSVSDGNPTELFSSLAIFFFLWGAVRGWGLLKFAGLGVFTILGVAAKPIAFFLIPALLIWLLVHYWRRIPALARFLFLPVAAISVYGAVLLSARIRSRALLFQPAIWNSIQEEAIERQSLLGRAWFETFRGFWADLGWGSLLINDTWTYLLLLLSLLAGVGLLKALLTPSESRNYTPSRSVILFLGLCVLVDLVIVSVDFLVKGFSLYDPRYLFGAIIPIMALLVIGWRELIPVGWRLEGLALLASFFFLFDAVVLLNYAVPFFYPLWR
jgi:hypothetical protein